MLGDLRTTPNTHGQATADERRAPAVRRRAQRRAAQSQPGHLDTTRTRRRRDACARQAGPLLLPGPDMDGGRSLQATDRIQGQLGSGRRRRWGGGASSERGLPVRVRRAAGYRARVRAQPDSGSGSCRRRGAESRFTDPH